MRLSHRLKNHLTLGLILLVYLIIAAAHSLAAPLTVGNDEWAHFLYVRFIAEHGRLPLNLAERNNREEAGYKADDPPLYHLLAAAATAAVEPTRLLRPIDSPRRQLADNVVYPFAFIVHTGSELFPYRGEVLLAHLVRGLSIFFALMVLGLTYWTSLELLPSRRHALMATTFLAFMPAMIFHTSMVSYESLSAALSALFLLLAIKAIKQPGRRRWWLGLGATAGLAITAKYSAVLLPLEIIFIAWLAAPLHPCFRGGHRPASPGLFFKRLFWAGLALLLACSWWFGFVVWHFNSVESKGWLVGILEPLIVRGAADSASVSIAATLFGEKELSTDTPPPRLERNYPALAQAMLESFWAGPVKGSYFGSPWLPWAASLLTLLGLIGLGAIWRRAGMTTRLWLVLLLCHFLLIVPLLIVRLLLSYDTREVAQGRHLLMPGASALAILLVWGWSQWRRKIGQIVIVGLLCWSLIGQLGWTALVYPPPMPVWAGQAPPEFRVSVQPLAAAPVNGVQLTGVSWQETPASALAVTLWWQALAVLPADYLIELTLLDAQNNPVSFTLDQPLQGRYPTRAWEAGDVIEDTHWLPLTGPLQGNYQLQLRLLTRPAQPLTEAPLLLGSVILQGPAYPTPNPCAVWFQGRPAPSAFFSQPYRQRSTLTVISPDPPTLTPLGEPATATLSPLVSVGQYHLFMVGPDWLERYQLRHGATLCGDLRVELPARSFVPPPLPQPLEANFNNQVKLLGYDLPTRRIQPGERLPLTLYWQSLAYMGQDYQIFDKLLDSEQRRWGGYDRRPRDGYSTLLWVPGEVISDPFGVPIDPAAPPGIYTLDLGLYGAVGTSAVSVPLVQAGQLTNQTSVRLGPIKVGGPPPGVTVTNPNPQVKLNQTLGGQITLLGYDTANCQLSIVNCQWSIKLYWRAEAVPGADYNTFLHWRNAANETVAQKDGPPAGGRYPTSLWDMGEIIVDDITLPVAEIPAGRYTPVVGLYNFASGERLAVPDHPANEIPLEQVELP